MSPSFPGAGQLFHPLTHDQADFWGKGVYQDQNIGGRVNEWVGTGASSTGNGVVKGFEAPFGCYDCGLLPGNRSWLA